MENTPSVELLSHVIMQTRAQRNQAMDALSELAAQLSQTKAQLNELQTLLKKSEKTKETK